MNRHGRLLLAFTLLLTVVSAFGQSNDVLSEDAKILHVLNRLTFGPRPGDVDEVRRMGLENWIEGQLHPERIRENPLLEDRLKPLDTLRMVPADISKEYSRNPSVAVLSALLNVRDITIQGLSPGERADIVRPDQAAILRTGTAQEILTLLNSFEIAQRLRAVRLIPEEKLNQYPEVRRIALRLQQPQQVISGDLREGKVYRAVYSTHQLEEVLVDFWFNHFNVYEGKSPIRNLVASYEREAIRPYVFGKFKDMLVATATHPAMLLYLDNWQSMSPQSYNPGPGQFVQLHGTSRGLNENYGRELLELHTLGVDGGYTQQDVLAAALAFTGWTIQSTSNPTFQFAAFAHHTREKTFLNQTMPAGRGMQDGLDVIAALAHHRSTARFISWKLAQRFVSDNPPQSLVDRMAETFLEKDGDLRAVLQTLFTSDEFFSDSAMQAKVKSPLEMTVSAARALQAEVLDAGALAQTIADMGQPLYNKVEPTGYANTAEPWLNTTGLLNRIKFASALASANVAGVNVNTSRFAGKNVGSIARELLGRDATAETLAAITGGVQGKQATPDVIVSLIIGSPEFQRK